MRLLTLFWVDNPLLHVLFLAKTATLPILPAPSTIPHSVLVAGEVGHAKDQMSGGQDRRGLKHRSALIRTEDHGLLRHDKGFGVLPYDLYLGGEIEQVMVHDDNREMLSGNWSSQLQ
jgi:hypothetical protein